MSKPLSKIEVRHLAKLAAQIAERQPSVTREFFKLMAALHNRSGVINTRFMALYNNATGSGNDLFSREELQTFGRMMVRLDKHRASKAPLPVAENLCAGPLVELRHELELSRSQLAARLRVPEPLVVMIESGKRPLDAKTAAAAFGLATSANARETLCRQLEYIAFEDS